MERLDSTAIQTDMLKQESHVCMSGEEFWYVEVGIPPDYVVTGCGSASSLLAAIMRARGIAIRRYNAYFTANDHDPDNDYWDNAAIGRRSIR